MNRSLYQYVTLSSYVSPSPIWPLLDAILQHLIDEFKVKSFASILFKPRRIALITPEPFFFLNNYFISKTKKPVTKQANSKELISYTVSYTKVYKLLNSRWEKKTE